MTNKIESIASLDVPLASKRCCGCKENKELECFSVDNSRKDRLQNRCKACRAKYRQDNKEARTEYNTQYYAEKILEAGDGVYLLAFSNGDKYIGSGGLFRRHQSHMGGASHVCCKLKKQGLDHIPIKFEVLFRGSKSASRLIEKKYISKYATSLEGNLLNKHGVQG